MSNRVESEIQSLLESLGTSPDKGLAEVDAYSRLRKFGTNELERPYLLFRQLKLAFLLCFAMGIMLLVEDAYWYAFGTTLIGVAMVVMAAILKNQYQQDVAAYNTDKTPSVCVGIRGGKLQQLPVCKLVPGDIVRIQAGEIVPADGRLTEAVNLAIQEESLSGNAEPVKKDAMQPNGLSESGGLCRNYVFMNTEVIHGRGTFVVIKTGQNTRIGIAKARVCARNRK